MSAVFHLEFTNGFHLRWPELDIDLELDALRHPEEYPLRFDPAPTDAAADRLLDEMAADDSYCCVNVHCDVPARLWKCSLVLASSDPDGEHTPMIRTQDPDRARAIRLAYTKWREMH